MAVSNRILKSISGDMRCSSCGKFVSLGEGKTLVCWTSNKSCILICHRCEPEGFIQEFIRDNCDSTERV